MKNVDQFLTLVDGAGLDEPSSGDQAFGSARAAFLGAALAAASGCTSKDFPAIGMAAQPKVDLATATCDSRNLDDLYGITASTQAGGWGYIYGLVGEVGTGDVLMSLSSDGGISFTYEFSRDGGFTWESSPTAEIVSLLGNQEFFATDYDESTGEWVFQANGFNFGTTRTKTLSGAPGSFTGPVDLVSESLLMAARVNGTRMGGVWNSALHAHEGGNVDTRVVFVPSPVAGFTGHPDDGWGFVTLDAYDPTLSAVTWGGGVVATLDLGIPGIPMDLKVDGSVFIQDWMIDSAGGSFQVYRCAMDVSTPDTGDTGDTAVVDTGTTTTDTGATTDTGGDSTIVVDTGDTQDTARDTGTPLDSSDTGHTGDTGLVDTGDSTIDTGDTAQACVEIGSGVENSPDQAVDYCSPTGVFEVSGSATLTLAEDGRPEIVFYGPGGSVTTNGNVIVHYPNSNITAQTFGPHTITLRAGDFGVRPPNADPNCDPSTGLQPTTTDTEASENWLLVENPDGANATVSSGFADLQTTTVPSGTTAYADTVDCQQGVDTGDTGDTSDTNLPDDTATDDTAQAHDSGTDSTTPHDSNNGHNDGTKEPTKEDPTGCSYTAYPVESGVAVSFLAALAAARRRRV